MTALTSINIRKQGNATPFCAMPNCRTTDSTQMPSYAFTQLFLLGHPIGWYCKKHAGEIKRAYEAAHGTFEPQEIAA